MLILNCFCRVKLVVYVIIEMRDSLNLSKGSKFESMSCYTLIDIYHIVVCTIGAEKEGWIGLYSTVTTNACYKRGAG